SPPTTVGRREPTLGCAATNAGLATTTISLSSCTMRMPSTGSARTVNSSGSRTGGSTTSTQSPDCSRSDLPTARPPTVTCPSPARSATRLRDRPSRRARPASTRSPSRPSGTLTVRLSATGVAVRGSGRVGLAGSVLGRLGAAGPVRVDPPESEYADQHGGGRDPDVGDVEDREVRQHQEVHHVALADARL